MSGPHVTAAVILAAGASRRLGTPKQGLVLDSETLVERALHTAQEAALSPVIVVVRPEAHVGHALQQCGCVIAVNEQADEGMASSIRLGVNIARMAKAKGVVLMTCDQVLLRPEHLQALCGEPERITGSAYAGKIGIPAHFPAASFADLLELKGDVGARELLRGAASIADEDLALDIDTQEDFDRAQRLLRGA